jgi:hypothetical protein
VAHTCNPIYSRGRDQEDQSLKPAQANSLQVAQGVGPEFKPQYCKKTKKPRTEPSPFHH